MKSRAGFFICRQITSYIYTVLLWFSKHFYMHLLSNCHNNLNEIVEQVLVGSSFPRRQYEEPLSFVKTVSSKNRTLNFKHGFHILCCFPSKSLEGKHTILIKSISGWFIKDQN